ncbi:transferase [Myroides sp. 1354]|uniref:transferase n=1 Tax=unclassified Myroides TaxID=2642485 RepID=UPI00257794FD|nr:MULTISPECIES: transferase [unclassified Myroides]MDM1046523.1 transferase [Myroides sp. R163-1]MDM1057476.1 transferase [Myroides sp. 1354]MDM1070761.1 transferase [Myroides sp. 1372]
MDKYRITKESMEYNGYILWRIECLKTSKKGGWIESEANLSQLGKAWIADNAKVYGNAVIVDNAQVGGNAEVFGAARIMGEAEVYGHALVSDYAIISDSAKVYDYATIEDSVQIYGYATIAGKASVAAYAKVFEYATVEGFAQVYDNVQVYGHAVIKDRAYLFKEACIKGYTIVSNNERVGENLYNWEDINALSKLEIAMVNGAKAAELYVNGRHQIAVKISLEARDRQNNILKIPAKEIFDYIEFVDEENNLIQQEITITDQPGLFVYPQERENKQKGDKVTSTAVIYVSLKELIKSFKLCVRCRIKQWTCNNGMEKIKRVEYTTAVEYNHGPCIPDYIHIKVVPKRQFNQANLRVQTFTEVDVNGILNSKLTKYYVQLNPNDGLIIRHVSCIGKKWFHYRQKGIYKGCSSSTDQSFVADDSAIFTAKFEFTSSKYRKVMSKNHEVDGVCFWVYQLWEGLIWSYYEWGGEMHFSLYDQYGNEVNLIAQAGEDEELRFYVRLEELNHE